jgi:hypothetical protein
MDEIDWALPFGCLPPSNENEWLNLSHFVDVYNFTYGKHYVPKSFPENDNRSTPEPEILLCDGDSKMVIERKVFPFPSSRIREHQLWHEFSHKIFENLSSVFSDNLYVLEIKDVDMPTSKREMLKLVDRITSDALKHEGELKDSEEVFLDGADDPNPWQFFRVSDMDREDAPIDYGVGVRLMNSLKFQDAQQIEDSISLVQLELSKIIERSVPKFENYNDCIRILILEPHTNVLNFLSDIFSPAIRFLEMPKNIDQIWLAVQIEINDDESVLDYRLIKGSKEKCL